MKWPWEVRHFADEEEYKFPLPSLRDADENKVRVRKAKFETIGPDGAFEVFYGEEGVPRFRYCPADPSMCVYENGQWLVYLGSEGSPA